MLNIHWCVIKWRGNLQQNMVYQILWPFIAPLNWMLNFPIVVMRDRGQMWWGKYLSYRQCRCYMYLLYDVSICIFCRQWGVAYFFNVTITKLSNDTAIDWGPDTMYIVCPVRKSEEIKLMCLTCRHWLCAL